MEGDALRQPHPTDECGSDDQLRSAGRIRKPFELQAQAAVQGIAMADRIRFVQMRCVRDAREQQRRQHPWQHARRQPELSSERLQRVFAGLIHEHGYEGAYRARVHKTESNRPVAEEGSRSWSPVTSPAKRER